MPHSIISVHHFTLLVVLHGLILSVAQRLLDDAKSKLKDQMRDTGRYQQMMQDLITQGLYQLLEQSVTVRCRAQDVQYVKVRGNDSERLAKHPLSPFIL